MVVLIPRECHIFICFSDILKNEMIKFRYDSEIIEYLYLLYDFFDPIY